MWTRKHGLKGYPLKILRVLVKFCLTMYFKCFFDIKVRHLLVDAPYHILTTLRILKTQPKIVQKTVTFYIRKNAWYAHPECLLLSLLSSSDFEDRQFAVDQILQKRDGNEYGDNSVRPRITPKLNLAATSLINLISWNLKEIQEPSFTCSRSTSEIESYRETPFVPPKFSCHTQSTERFVHYSLSFSRKDIDFSSYICSNRAVALTTEASEAVCRQDAREGYIKVSLSERGEMSKFTTKKHVLKTFSAVVAS